MASAGRDLAADDRHDLGVIERATGGSESTGQLEHRTTPRGEAGSVSSGAPVGRHCTNKRLYGFWLGEGSLTVVPVYWMVPQYELDVFHGAFERSSCQ